MVYGADRSAFHQAGSDGIADLDEEAERGLRPGCAEALLVLGVLERKVPCCHVPTDREHLLRCQLQSPGKEHDHGLLTMAEGRSE